MALHVSTDVCLVFDSDAVDLSLVERGQILNFHLKNWRRGSTHTLPRHVGKDMKNLRGLKVYTTLPCAAGTWSIKEAAEEILSQSTFNLDSTIIIIL